MAYLGREAAKAPLVTADIPDDSITAAKIVDATIAAGDLAANSVDSSELVDGSVDLSHMSVNSIDSDQYVDGSIDTIHVADNAISLAKLAGFTDGMIITADASGDPALVGPGADGQVLTSTGAGSPPAFEDAAGGGKILQVQGSDNFHTQGPFDSDHDIVIETNLTGVLASSWVAVWTTLTIYIYNSGSNEGFETHIYRKATSSMGAVGSAQSGGTKINATGGENDVATLTYLGDASSNYKQTPYFCIDKSPATGTNYYALIGSSYLNSPSIESGGNCSILVMEIAQ